MSAREQAVIAFPPALLDAIADRVVDRLVDVVPQPARVPEAWLNVEQAAAYIAAPESRVYDLVRLGRLRVAKDGRRSLFRREWLDGAIEPAE